jgi:hypothetical protein
MPVSGLTPLTEFVPLTRPEIRAPFAVRLPPEGPVGMSEFELPPLHAALAMVTAMPRTRDDQLRRVRVTDATSLEWAGAMSKPHSHPLGQ